MTRGPERRIEHIGGAIAGKSFLPEGGGMTVGVHQSTGAQETAGSPLILEPDIPLVGGIRAGDIGFVAQYWGKNNGKRGSEEKRSTTLPAGGKVEKKEKDGKRQWVYRNGAGKHAGGRS